MGAGVLAQAPLLGPYHHHDCPHLWVWLFLTPSHQSDTTGKLGLKNSSTCGTTRGRCSASETTDTKTVPQALEMPRPHEAQLNPDLLVPTGHIQTV